MAELERRPLLGSTSSSKASAGHLPEQGWFHMAPSGTALPYPWVIFLGSSPEGVCSDVCVRVSETEIEK